MEAGNAKGTGGSGEIYDAGVVQIGGRRDEEFSGGGEFEVDRLLYRGYGCSFVCCRW